MPRTIGRSFIGAIGSLAILTSCSSSDSDGPAPADISSEQFAVCDGKGKTYFNSWCLGKTVELYSIVDSFYSDGVRMRRVDSDCNKLDSNASYQEFDMPSLEKQFFEENEGRCIRFIGKIDEYNALKPNTPDMSLVRVDWEESAEQLVTRMLEEKKSTSEKMPQTSTKTDSTGVSETGDLAATSGENAHAVYYCVRQGPSSPKRQPYFYRLSEAEAQQSLDRMCNFLHGGGGAVIMQFQYND